jgi:hypothetical protein
MKMEPLKGDGRGGGLGGVTQVVHPTHQGGFALGEVESRDAGIGQGYGRQGAQRARRSEQRCAPAGPRDPLPNPKSFTCRPRRTGGT